MAEGVEMTTGGLVLLRERNRTDWCASAPYENFAPFAFLAAKSSPSFILPRCDGEKVLSSVSFASFVVKSLRTYCKKIF
jgi:hypothetical protein